MKKRTKTPRAPHAEVPVWQSDVPTRLLTILKEVLNVDDCQIVLGASLEDDLNADSLDRIEIIMGCEDAFGVDVLAEQIEALTTVQSLVDLLRIKGVELN